jgi:hypothetical protein
MAKMSSKMMKAYAAYEKKESPATKKKEAKAGMHMMNGKLMKNSAMKGKTKRMGKVK